MIRLFAFILALAVASPTFGQGLSAEAVAKQTQAIAVRVQQQLMECWMVPPGEEDQRMALDIVFFGDGTLDGEAMLAPESGKAASKRGVLKRSILAAVERCVPFEGLQALGAQAEERFSVTIYFQS